MLDSLTTGLKTRYNQANKFFRRAGSWLKRDYIDPVSDSKFWKAIPESMGSWSDQGRRAVVAIPAMLTNLPSDAINAATGLYNIGAGITNWVTQRNTAPRATPVPRIVGGTQSDALLKLNGEFGRSADAVNGVDIIGAAVSAFPVYTKVAGASAAISNKLSNTAAKFADKIIGDEVAIMSGKHMSDLAKSGGLPVHRARFKGSVPLAKPASGVSLRNQAPQIQENLLNLPDSDVYDVVKPGTWFRTMTMPMNNSGPGVSSLTDITKNPTYFTPNYGVVTHGNYTAYAPAIKHTANTPITVAATGKNMILRSPQGYPVAVPDNGAAFLFSKSDLPKHEIVHLSGRHNQHAFNQLGRLANSGKSVNSIKPYANRYFKYIFGDNPSDSQLAFHENVRYPAVADDITDIFVTDVAKNSPQSLHYGLVGVQPSVSFGSYSKLPPELLKKLPRLFLRRLFPYRR